MMYLTFSLPELKGHVRYCHHFVSVIVGDIVVVVIV